MSQSSAVNNSRAYFVSEHKIPLDCPEDPIIYLSPMAGILSEYFWWDSNIWIGRNGHLLVSLTSDLSYTIQNTNTKYKIKVQNTNATLWSSFTWWHTFGCKYKLRFQHLNWKKWSLVSLAGNLSSGYLVELDGITIYAESSLMSYE